MPTNENNNEDNKPEKKPLKRDTRERVNVRVPSRLMKIIKEKAVHNDRSVSSLVIEALWEKYREEEEK